jgi:predicted nucleic acid-binding protein
MEWVVVDASVAIKWVYSEDLSQQALSIRKRFHLVAPDLIVAEWSNILWKKVRRGEFGEEEAVLAAASLRHAGIELVPSMALSPGALQLAIELDHPAYDCFYLELCRTRGIPMVTADNRFARKIAAANSRPLLPVITLDTLM